MKRFSDADRTYTNQSDGKTFYGYDDADKCQTTWYDEKGNLDCVTSYGGGSQNNNDDGERQRKTRRR